MSSLTVTSRPSTKFTSLPDLPLTVNISVAMHSTNLVMEYLEKDEIMVQQQAVLQAIYNVFAKVMIWQKIEDPSVVFLDIDGVLNKEKDVTKVVNKMHGLFPNIKVKEKHFYIALTHFYDKPALANIKTTLSLFSKAIVVISSNWGSEKSIALSREILWLHEDSFASLIGDKISDDLDHHCDPNTEKLVSRGEKIKYFLEEHPSIKRFVVIDDLSDEDLEELFPNNFVHVDDEKLFSVRDAAKAVTILSRQQSPKKPASQETTPKDPTSKVTLSFSALQLKS